MYSKLLFFCIIVTLLFSGSASIPLQKRFTGAATFYDVGLGACGETNTPDQLIAAAGASRFDSATPKGICGQKASITGPKGSVTVVILDRCAGCGDNDLDLSTGAFQQIADFTQGRVPITWTFVGGGGDGGSGDNTAPPPKEAPPAPPETTTTSTSTTSTTPTSTTTTTTTTTSTTSTSTTSTTPTPTPTADTQPVNNVAAAFLLGQVFNDLANVDYTPANSPTTPANSTTTQP